MIPSARGEAQRIRLDAEGSAAETVERARGEADRFDRMVAQLGSGREVTAQRLILETLEEVLPRLKKILLDDKAQKQLDLGIIEDQ